MKNLIKAQWFQLSRSSGFQILLFCNAAAFFTTIILLMFWGSSKSTAYDFLRVAMAYVLHHTIIGYFFAAMFLSSEFSNRTAGMSLLCGHSRRAYFLSKVFVFFASLLILFMVYAVNVALASLLVNGAGMEWNQENFGSIIQLLFRGIFGCMTMGSVMILIACIFRKTIGTIAGGIGLTYVLMFIENNMREKTPFFVKYQFTYQIRMLWDGSFDAVFSAGRFWEVLGITFLLAMTAAILVFDKMELK